MNIEDPQPETVEETQQEEKPGGAQAVTVGRLQNALETDPGRV